jgi:hypothetical protein
MTAHASKGLEFPFVWVTLPLEEKGGNNDKWHTFSEHGTRVYDLTMSHKEQHDHERGEEAKRLLYVALTRGIFRTVLYFKESDPRYLSLPAPPEPDMVDDTPWQPDRTDEMVGLPEPLFALAEQFLKDGYRRRRVSLASFSSLAGHSRGRTRLRGDANTRNLTNRKSPLPELEGTILCTRGPGPQSAAQFARRTVDFAAAAMAKRPSAGGPRRGDGRALPQPHPARAGLERRRGGGPSRRADTGGLQPAVRRPDRPAL